MLRSLKQLFDYKVVSHGEKLGTVRDVHFDDREWTVRYFEIDTGGWLSGRRILVSPHALGQPDWTEKILPVTISRDQIEASPVISDVDRIDRDREIQLYTYYGWQPYWAGGIMAQPGKAAISDALGSGRETTLPMTEGSLKGGAMAEGHVRDNSLSELDDANRPVSGPSRKYSPSRQESQPEVEPNVLAHANIRSCQHVLGFHLQATDGEIGHVEDFIVDDENWVLRYAVIDTRNWLPGKKVLLATWWINRVNWDDEKVDIDLTRETIKNSPEYDPSAPINRQYEEVFFDYYGRPKYWQ